MNRISGLSNAVKITTLDDPRVDPFRNVRDADLRGRDHLCMVESEMVVKRLLETNWEIHSLLISPNKCERLSRHLHDRDIPILIADISLMSEITGFNIHRGVLAAVRRPPSNTHSVQRLIERFQGEKQLSILMAEGITNIDNMGSLFRNAAAFGVNAIVLDECCCDPLYRKSIRVSMGHTFSIPFAITDSWIHELPLLKHELNIKLIGCELSDHAVPVWQVDQGDRFGLIMGGEKHGLSKATIDQCDVVAQIPMSDAVPSINVAIASAVALYEFLRGDSFNNG
ncbi:MAG: RNA methyltransferase [Planctomycetota bacterium]|nr:RNA methyltransferase [Planctomycetota bacterium]